MSGENESNKQVHWKLYLLDWSRNEFMDAYHAIYPTWRRLRWLFLHLCLPRLKRRCELAQLCAVHAGPNAEGLSMCTIGDDSHLWSCWAFLLAVIPVLVTRTHTHTQNLLWNLAALILCLVSWLHAIFVDDPQLTNYTVSGFACAGSFFSPSFFFLKILFNRPHTVLNLFLMLRHQPVRSDYLFVLW